MKNRNPNGNGNGGGSMVNDPKPMTMKKKRNMNRLGGSGSGLSLQAFANAKSTNNQYNPALIKKKREFYQNAKYVNKYKKSLKHQNQGNSGLASATRAPEDGNEDASDSRTNRMSYNKNNNNMKKKNSPHGLKEVYEKQWEEKEKARIEREAAIQAKKEHREKAEAQRKAGRKEMFKRTKHGQPVMKYRIEHLLQSIQSSSST